VRPNRKEIERRLKRSALRGIPPGRTCRLPEREQRWLERLLLLIGRLMGGGKGDGRW